VGTLEDIELPLSERRLISHLFHQVEKELEEWLNLAVTLIAQRVQNMAIVTVPRPAAGQFKHFGLVLLHDNLALAVLVFRGARVRQQLVTFGQVTSQANLAVIASKLNAAYSGLTRSQIGTKKMALSPAEQQVTDCLLEMMMAEDRQQHKELYIDGLHFMLNQPEFSHNQRILPLMELVEQRRLVGVTVPEGLEGSGVQVIIGQENKAEVIQDLSVVISRYGLPDEAVGTIGVIGPTRMPYAHAISTIGYLSSLMSGLVAELYGKEPPDELSLLEVK
jgi:heat-inducible transcriptional repressor